jgi:hypothetical protein
MEMLCVDASDQFIVKRLSRRAKGIASDSAAALRRDFELPDRDTKVITNQSGESEIIQQLNHYFSKPKNTAT